MAGEFFLFPYHFIYILYFVFESPFEGWLVTARRDILQAACTMSRDRPARMTITAAIIILALAVSGTLGYLVGPLSDDVHEPRLDKKSQPAPGDGYMYLRGELTHRTLWSAGAPAEGLLLAEANSAEGVSGSTSQASRAMNPGEGRHKDLLPVNK